MSIIYDALKKVETSQVNGSKEETDKGFKPKPRIYLLYALIICLGFFVANIFYGWLSSKPALKTTDIVTGDKPAADKKEPVSSDRPPTATLQTSASVETKMETKEESPPVFTLNGVFFSGAEGYALINNRVVKKGDKVDGATVAQISLDEVDLEFGGSVIKLSNSAR